MVAKNNLLICDENADSRVVTRKAAQRALIDVLGEVGYGTDALSFAVEARPGAILVAVEEPVGRPLETVKALVEALPNVPVIVYSTLDSPEAVRRSMVLGARDYIVQPVESGRLQEAVRAAIAQEEHRAQRNGHDVTEVRGSVITVSGGKGGIGKTVTSCNLAIALHQETGKSVALLDADTQFGDVATMLDLDPKVTAKDLLMELSHVDRAGIRDYLVKHESGVDVLATLPDDDAWFGCGAESVKRLLDLLSQTYDFVVVDTAGSFDPFVRAWAEASTLILVITTGEVSSIRDTSAALRRLQSWGIGEDRFKVLLNRRVNTDGLGLSDLRRTVIKEVFWEIPHDRRVATSVQLGQPVMVHPNGSSAARNFRSLAGVIAGTRSVASAKRSFWDAFKFASLM